MDRKGNPICNTTLISDLVFPNALESILQSVMFDHLCKNQLRLAMANMQVSEFADIENIDETHVKTMFGIVLHNETSKVGHIINCYQEKYRKTVESMLLFHLKAMSNLYTSARDEVVKSQKAHNQENIPNNSSSDPELKEINRNIALSLQILTSKLCKDDSSKDNATKFESYNKSPTEPPPIFNPNKHSIKRFYEVVFMQWRLEQKLHRNDEFIWFHKCFNKKHRPNIFNILSSNKNRGMDYCLAEITKFFALSEIEIFDLREKFFTYKQSKQESTLDVFNALYDLQSSISPELRGDQIIQVHRTRV